MTVGVKFCGHCAPRRDMTEVYAALRAQAPELLFCCWAEKAAADALLILNACRSECASRPAFLGPVVVVSPEAVDHWPTPPDQLCPAILQRLRAALSG